MGAMTRLVVDKHGNKHEVHAHYILSGMWEYYQLEEKDEFGVMFGYMTNCPYPEFGSQHEAEITDVMISKARGKQLWHIAPPVGWKWLEKEKANV